MTIKYLIGIALGIPLMPIIYVQGKKIRKQVPKLSEAKGNGGNCYKENQKAVQVLFIGESTFAGVGVQTHEEGFAGTFAKELSNQINRSVYWKVYAKSGYTAELIYKKLIPKIEEKEVDLIIVGIGGNDAFQLTTIQKWDHDIDKLIKDLQIKFPEGVIVFTNMPPIKEFPAFTLPIKFIIGNLVEILGEKLNKRVQSFQKTYYNNRVIRINEWKGKISGYETNEKLFSDGVHPSKLAYQIWANEMVIFVLKNAEIIESLRLKE
jgi:lysophospholipase L1-like esterase